MRDGWYYADTYYECVPCSYAYTYAYMDGSSCIRSQFPCDMYSGNYGAFWNYEDWDYDCFVNMGDNKSPVFRRVTRLYEYEYEGHYIDFYDFYLSGYLPWYDSSTVYDYFADESDWLVSVDCYYMQNCDGTRDYNYRICHFISEDHADCRDYYETDGDFGTCAWVDNYTEYLIWFKHEYNTRPWCYFSDWYWD